MLAASLLAQWLIYDDWLHRTGPLRIVGTCIAALVTFIFAMRWQLAIRERQLEMDQVYIMPANCKQEGPKTKLKNHEIIRDGKERI